MSLLSTTQHPFVELKCGLNAHAQTSFWRQNTWLVRPDVNYNTKWKHVQRTPVTLVNKEGAHL